MSQSRDQALSGFEVALLRASLIPVAVLPRFFDATKIMGRHGTCPMFLTKQMEHTYTVCYDSRDCHKGWKNGGVSIHDGDIPGKSGVALRITAYPHQSSSCHPLWILDNICSCVVEQDSLQIKEWLVTALRLLPYPHGLCSEMGKELVRV